jgi:hypothetical protein
MSEAKRLLEELIEIYPDEVNKEIEELTDEESEEVTEEMDLDTMELESGDTAVVDLEVKVTMGKEGEEVVETSLGHQPPRNVGIHQPVQCELMGRLGGMRQDREKGARFRMKLEPVIG